jgi:hypothetical protein
VRSITFSVFGDGFSLRLCDVDFSSSFYRFFHSWKKNTLSDEFGVSYKDLNIDTDSEVGGHVPFHIGVYRATS